MTRASPCIPVHGDLTEIACNDDAVGAASTVTFDAIAGVTYFFKVGAFGGGGGGNLVFNVNVAPPPLEVDLTLDRVGSVDPTTGIAIIRGTVTCSRDVFADISGEFRQRIGRAIIVASFFTFFECHGVTQWEAEVAPQNALLVGGRAEVTAFAFFFDPVIGESASDSESATVRVTGGGN